MSSEDSVGTLPLVTPSERLVGRVKWFNNKAGYGFITVSDGDRAGSDVFAHHSAIVVVSEQYKYLVQGEYVSFVLSHTPGGAHEYQAGDISGINGGKPMCETRYEFKQSRVSYSKTTEKSGSAEVPSEVKPPRSSRPPREEGAPRVRGSGPREGGEWTIASNGRNKSATSAEATGAPRARGRPPRATKKDA